MTFLLLLGLAPAAGRGDDKRPDKPSLMKQKLAAAQKVLEGLALNDYTLIEENAGKLNDLSKQAAWKLIETPRYGLYSDEFQRITLKMANDAKKKDINAATLAYVEMTMNCVRCHEHVREVRIGQGRPPSDLKSSLGQ
jgi:hypothetical protein